MFKKAFAMFDSGKTGSIEKEKVRTILNTLGHTYDDKELMDMLDQEDEEGLFLFFLLIRYLNAFTKNSFLMTILYFVIKK